MQYSLANSSKLSDKNFSLSVTSSSTTPKPPASVPKRIQPDPDESKFDFRAIQKKINDGDPAAIFFLGLCFYTGEQVPQDYAKAALYLGKAAALGNVDAMVIYGHCLHSGNGIQKNDEISAAGTYSCGALYWQG